MRASRDRGGLTVVAADARTEKSNLISQLERRDGVATKVITVVGPAAKMQPWVDFYEPLKKTTPNQIANFSSIEEIEKSEDPVGAFNSLFIEADWLGERTIIIEDSQDVFNRRLGPTARSPLVINLLVGKMCLVESLGIKLYIILHGPGPAALRLFYKDVFINDSFGSDGNYAKLSAAVKCTMSIPACMRFVKNVEDVQDKPQLGINPDTGVASATVTSDGSLSAKIPEHRFMRIQKGKVCKGLGDYYLRRVNQQEVEVDHTAAGLTYRSPHEDFEFTVLPPGAFHEHLRKNGMTVEPGDPNSMVDPNKLSAVAFFKAKMSAAQFQRKRLLVNRGFGAGKFPTLPSLLQPS
jgi:hypothetical protein